MGTASTIGSLAAGAAMLIAAPGHAQTREPEPYKSPWKTAWAYTGPRGATHWAALDTAYAACNEGRAQSPIAIRQTHRDDLPALRFESRAAPLPPVINNGHTIRVDFRPGNGDSLLAEGRRYELTQFHFHHPGEETVAGTRYPMATHLMYAARDGKVAGVTIFIRAGRPNPVVATLWAHMPQTEGQTVVTATDLDPAGLLPPDTRGYFAYEGSLSAPPCTEGVVWYVLKTPIEVSPAQIAAFARLYPMDARPVQPLNGRIVRETR